MPGSPLTPEDPSTAAVVCVECQNGVIGPTSALTDLTAHTNDLVASSTSPAPPACGWYARLTRDHWAKSTFRPHASSGHSSRRPPKDTGKPPTHVIPELLALSDLVLPRHHGIMPSLNTELLPVLANLVVAL